MNPRLKNTTEAIKSQNSSQETRFLQINTIETQVRTDYRNFYTKTKETRFLQINMIETQVRTNYRNFYTKTKHLLNAVIHTYLE